LFNFNGVHELSAKGFEVLDKKSKQKNQEKIIPAFTHKALRLAAIFSGHRALLFLNVKTSRFKFLPDNNESK
jgi:hypothetical protein